MMRFQTLSTALCLVAGAILSSCSRSTDSRPVRDARAAAGSVPVVAGKVQQRDTPIYLDGIGTVQAFNTVTIHAQVDGVLQKVAFEEGQEVKAGDLLAQIDPRSYQAQLDGAKAEEAAGRGAIGQRQAHLPARFFAPPSRA